ncbi:MAG: helix-turn-helix domain-containing protein [Ruminococcaceae bacterium]|nr:helix-turn-helix domain-containing protein [Oscillospiraceae bacterium]
MKHLFEVSACGEAIRLRTHEDLFQMQYVWACDRHSHADYEVHLILRGSCTVNVGQTPYDLQSPQALLIAPGQYHFLPQPLSGQIERFSLCFSMKKGPLLSALQAAVPASISFPVSKELETLCRSIFHESAARNPFRYDMLHTLLSALMIHVFRGAGVSVTHAGFIHGRDEDMLNKIDTFIEKNASGHATAEQLATELKLSRRQLARILQQHYGKGFRELLIRTRMDSAQWLLKNTQKPVLQIAGELGYDSESAFYQQFRARFGMSPVQYRKSHTES